MSLSEKGSDSVVDGDVKREHLDSELNADPAFERRTIRRVDLYLLPMLVILYSISLTDRINISNAYIAGMAADLQLQIGSRYSIASLIFFVPFILLELPSNIVMRKIGAARWIGTITTLWGIVTLGMGFTKTWWELVICRVLLGALESGFLPACTYIISTWYVRKEIQKRMTAFYIVAVMMAGFSSAIAGGISEMAGIGGLGGWQWIFILMGLVTIVCGLGGFVFVQDFPDKNKFLTAEQTAFVLARIDEDRSDAEYDHWTMSKLWCYVTDFHLWLFALMLAAAFTTAYSFSLFLPIILVQGLGYSVLEAQLLNSPPSIFAAIFCFGLAWLSDKYTLRAPLLIFQGVMTIVGLCLTAFHTHNAVRYFGSFLGVAGSAGNIPAILGYMQNNITGYTKRSFASALTIGGAGIGGIIASTVFRAKDAPAYRPGLWVAIGAQFVIIFTTCIFTVVFYYKNKAVREGRAPPIDGRPGFYHMY
ncbi:MFS transporter superfamily protein [Pleurotus pulmonarius]